MRGFRKTYARPVPGYGRLHTNVTKAGSRLRSDTQKRMYVSSRLRLDTR